MRGRLDIFIHQPVRNLRETRRVRDAAEVCPICNAKSCDHTEAERKAHVKDATGRHHPETGGVKTPINDTITKILSKGK